MDKRELLDILDNFSKELLNTLAEVEAIKKHLQSIVGENTQLRLENDKLRERLGQEDKGGSDKCSQGRDNLEKIYNDSFHVCHLSYGQRRDTDEECAFCLELLYRE